MAKVLRLTRHEVQPAQVAELRRLYGPDVEIVTVSETVQDAARARELVREHGADVLEAVLPLPLLAQAVDPKSGVGVPVIRAVMDREQRSETEVNFVFRSYEKVKRIVVETDPL